MCKVLWVQKLGALTRGRKRCRGQTGLPEKVASAVPRRVSWMYGRGQQRRGGSGAKAEQKDKGGLWSENRTAAELCVVRGEDAE